MSQQLYSFIYLFLEKMGEGRHEGDGKRFIHIRLQNQTAMETIITLGVGKRLTFTLGHDMACCEHLWLCYKLGTPLQSVETDLSIVFSLSACISTNHGSSPPPALPLERLCFHLWGFSLPFHTIWVDGQGQYLLSETNSSDKTGPKPVCSRFEWQTLNLDLGDPLFK